MTFALTAILMTALAPLIALGLWSMRTQREAAAAPVISDGRPVRLSQLEDDRLVRVASLDEHCAGLSRRRMLDFGLTPGAKVQRELAGAFGTTSVYRVRGALLALRREQADHVWVTTADN